MFESVPVAVELAIYLYFLLVATVGLSLYWRLWRTARPADAPGAENDPAHTDREQTVD